MEIINATDGYKLGHHRMYPEGTQMVYSNWTPRSNRYFPDAGAEKRNEFRYNRKAITCSKVRDLTTGRILEIKIDNPENIQDKPLLILDDLCDGGGTFCGIAKAFNALGISKERLNIAVTHMVNPKGIKNLSENFNHVWFTNSYKDWDNLPENVTMFKVI